MSHPIRLFFEVLGTLVALALVGVALLLWRLSAGPIAVPFVTPLLEAALAAEESPFEIVVGETWLDWSGWPISRGLNLLAKQPPHRCHRRDDRDGPSFARSSR